MHSASILSLIFIGLFIAAISIAGVFGRTAERTGAALLAANTIFTLVAQATVSFAPLYCLLAIDLATVVGLACITRANPEKLWPSLATCAQLLVAMFSVTRLIHFPLSEDQYLLMVSICTMLTVSALLGGTLVGRFFPRPPSDWDLAYESR